MQVTDLIKPFHAFVLHICYKYSGFNKKTKQKKRKEEGRGDWEVERGVTYKWCVRRGGGGGGGGGVWRVGAGSLVVILDMRPNHYWSSRKYHNVARDG